jgi:hypothetical protein
MTILENGNLNNNFGSNVETALDIEAAHAVATHVGMKYYASDWASVTPPGSGLTNAGCNGSDVGLEMAIEDAANDPTLHSVSNSWAFGGEAEWGASDPFLLASENSFQLAAAAGTTFYFSTGDSGTYESGYPSDSAYVVGRRGPALPDEPRRCGARAPERRRQLVLERDRPAAGRRPGVAANAFVPAASSRRVHGRRPEHRLVCLHDPNGGTRTARSAATSPRRRS